MERWCAVAGSRVVNVHRSRPRKVHRVEKIISKPFEIQNLVASAVHLAASASGATIKEEPPPASKR